MSQFSSKGLSCISGTIAPAPTASKVLFSSKDLSCISGTNAPTPTASKALLPRDLNESAIFVPKLASELHIFHISIIHLIKL